MPDMSNAFFIRVFAAGAVTGLVGVLARWAMQRRARRANPAHERLARYVAQRDR